MSKFSCAPEKTLRSQEYDLSEICTDIFGNIVSYLSTVFLYSIRFICVNVHTYVHMYVVDRCVSLRLLYPIYDIDTHTYAHFYSSLTFDAV